MRWSSPVVERTASGGPRPYVTTETTVERLRIGVSVRAEKNYLTRPTNGERQLTSAPCRTHAQKCHRAK